MAHVAVARKKEIKLSVVKKAHLVLYRFINKQVGVTNHRNQPKNGYDNLQFLGNQT